MASEQMKDKIFLRTAKFVRRVSMGHTPLTFLCTSVAAIVVAIATFFVASRFPALSDYAAVIAIALPVLLSILLYFALIKFAKAVLRKHPSEIFVKVQENAHISGKVKVRRRPFEAPNAIRLRKVSAKTISVFSEINAKLFSKTRYAYPKDRIIERNLSFFERDPMTSLFVCVDGAIGRKKIVGISHVLPLNSAGAAAYFVDGGLSDSQLSGVHLSASQEQSENFVLFSLGMDWKTLASFGAQPSIIGGMFVGHLKAMLLDRLARGILPQEVTVWAQVTKPKGVLGVALSRAGMTRTTLKSGDGSSFFKMKLSGLSTQVSIQLQAERIHSALS